MNIALCGIHGAMGKILKEEIEQSKENKLVGYFSPRNDIKGQDISDKIDVIIDFSRPENIPRAYRHREYRAEKSTASL